MRRGFNRGTIRIRLDRIGDAVGRSRNPHRHTHATATTRNRDADAACIDRHRRNIFRRETHCARRRDAFAGGLQRAADVSRDGIRDRIIRARSRRCHCDSASRAARDCHSATDGQRINRRSFIRKQSHRARRRDFRAVHVGFDLIGDVVIRRRDAERNTQTATAAACERDAHAAAIRSHCRAVCGGKFHIPTRDRLQHAASRRVGPDDVRDRIARARARRAHAHATTTAARRRDCAADAECLYRRVFCGGESEIVSSGFQRSVIRIRFDRIGDAIGRGRNAHRHAHAAAAAARDCDAHAACVGREMRGIRSRQSQCSRSQYPFTRRLLRVGDVG